MFYSVYKDYGIMRSDRIVIQGSMHAQRSWLSPQISSLDTSF